MQNKIDVQNMYKAILQFPDNIKEAIKLVSNFSVKNKYKKINNVVVSGMGGSAIGADIVSAIGKESIEIPFFISRDYKLPNWVNQNTLVICSSYSGNTEETISCFDDAKVKRAQICGITTGGILEKKLKSHNMDYIIIPSGLQPRAALAFSFIPISKILKELSVLKFDFDILSNHFFKNIYEAQKIYSLESKKNPVYLLAKYIHKKIPIIYADSSTLSVVAKRIKGQIAENSKMIAYQSDLPEFNHNEIVGWANNKNLLNNFIIIWLKDPKDHKRVKFRQKISKEIFDEIGIKQYSIEKKDSSYEERFLHMIHFGDWLSYWCAILHNTDPTPVINIDRIKNSLNNLK